MICKEREKENEVVEKKIKQKKSKNKNKNLQLVTSSADMRKGSSSKKIIVDCTIECERAKSNKSGEENY